MTETTYVALGSNLGDRATSLYDALGCLANIGEVIKTSNIYETAPWGVAEPQPSYLNMAAALVTELEPLPLLRALLEIESVVFGRVRLSPQYPSTDPRSMDLDILLYGNRVVSEHSNEFLFIPHLRMHQRNFVLVPLSEIAPDMIHPVTKKTITQMAEGTSQTGIKLWKPAPSSTFFNKQPHKGSQ